MDLLLDGNYSRKENFHVSLYYGNESCNKIGEEFNELKLKIPENLHIQSIALVDLEGSVEEWNTMGTLELANEVAE